MSPAPSGAGGIPGESSASWGGILGAWLAPCVLGGLATGVWLLVQNAGGGMTWQGVLVLLGAPVALAGGVGLVFGLLFASASRGGAVLRRTGFHAGTAALLVGGYFGNAVGRSLLLSAALRVPLALVVGASAATLAARWARRPLGGALARGLACAALLATLGFAVAAATLAPEGGGAGGDPRDEVASFDPLASPPERQPLSERVILLGLDGATWNRIDPLLSQGRLPNFARLKREGACGPLKTIRPTLSAPIWTTIATGKPPAEHGIRRHYLNRTRFLRRPDLRMETWMGPVRDLLDGMRLVRIHPVTSNLRRCKAVWNIASESGLRVAALGWWASQPPEPLNGWVVSEFASAAQRKEFADEGRYRNYREGARTHPPELLDELAPLERSPESLTREDLAAFLPVDDEVWEEFLRARRFDPTEPLSIFRATYLKDLFFAEAALHLDRTRRPDLLLSYLKGIDVFGHMFWRYSAREALEEGEDPRLVARYRDCVDRAYEWTDRLLGRYLER
ncbi:MAG TPA: alkaline phosphatase family protein, partial [Planctomycetota bacterium]|nr:alkaline phosphatase family protein [Planctomycetota bacterium]